MDLVWLVYGISLLTPIGSLFTFIVAICICTIVALLVYRGAECSQEDWYKEDKNKKQAEKAVWAMNRIKTALKVLIPCLIVMTFLPAPKTAYMMVGAYAAQKMAENGKVQETGGKVLELINQKLDSYIDEGMKEAEAKVSKEIKE
jgi:lysylphosphatidylglycerol synthetase-like protein (DUF2156 family)